VGIGNSVSTGDHTIRLTIPAKAEYVSLCRLALSGLARVQPFEDETLADLKLAITEAASNSVRHAYSGGGGVVEVVFRLDGERLEVEVVDTGAGFDPEPRDGNGDELSEGGLGIAIIRAIADDFELSSDAGGSRLRFAKRLA
jgi:serine/threonine-protein kinase RsbW